MKLETVGKSKPNCQGAKLHRHPDWELIYNISGTGTMTVGEHIYTFSPGTLLLCPPGVLHNKVPDVVFSDLYMRFSNFDGPAQVSWLKDTYDHRLLQLMQLIHSVHYENTAPSVCENLLDAIMGLVRPMLLGMEQSEYVRMLRHTIADNYTDPDFSIRDAMSRIPLNGDHLRRRFVKEIGTTPQAYLSRLRIEKAKRLLREDHRSVADVAYRCGFYDALYFSKVFRKATGITPSKWN